MYDNEFHKMLPQSPEQRNDSRDGGKLLVKILLGETNEAIVDPTKWPQVKLPINYERNKRLSR